MTTTGNAAPEILVETELPGLDGEPPSFAQVGFSTVEQARVFRGALNRAIARVSAPSEPNADLRAAIDVMRQAVADGEFRELSATGIVDRLVGALQLSGYEIRAVVDRPQVAREIRVVRDGGKARIEVDGQPFPWRTRDWRVPVNGREMPSLEFALLAQRVLVDDTILAPDGDAR